jgi:hypothetical protein
MQMIDANDVSHGSVTAQTAPGGVIASHPVQPGISWSRPGLFLALAEGDPDEVESRTLKSAKVWAKKYFRPSQVWTKTYKEVFYQFGEGFEASNKYFNQASLCGFQVCSQQVRSPLGRQNHGNNGSVHPFNLHPICH